MAYIDSTYYLETYHGVDAGSDFDRLAERASDDIDMATQYRIVIADLAPALLGMVKKAVCAQVEFYIENGDTYNESGSGSESIGKFSHSASSRPAPASLCMRARQYLEQTGLTYRGAVVCSPVDLGDLE